METYFAPPDRLSPHDIQRQIYFASSNPVISGVLKASAGLIAILNEHRQILAVNEAFLLFLGIEDPGRALGLRPGESVGCVHAHDTEGGCGTGRWCSSCGAAIAIVASLASGSSEERKCALTIRKNGAETTLCLAVRSSCLTLESMKFILLYLQDITESERRTALENLFLHDLKNLVTGLCCTAELLPFDNERENRMALQNFKRLSARLRAELDVQTALAHSSGNADYQPAWQDVPLAAILVEVQTLFEHHNLALDKKIIIAQEPSGLKIRTDPPLLLRVLTNMLTNALEATDRQGEAKLWVEATESTISFLVWNDRHIPEEVARRIFQQYFSMKEGSGRGFGTYSMKLIGEKFLRGKVTFTTSKTAGTVFRIELPLVNQPLDRFNH